MKNKVLKQMLAFSLAVALVGGNSVATFAAEPTNGTESGANTQAATDATAEKVAVVNFNIENGKFDNGTKLAQYQLRAGDVQDLPKVTVDDGYEFLGWKVSGKSETTWKASKKSFTFEDANANFYPATATEGYTTVTAKVEKVEKKKTAHITFNVDPEKGKFTDPANAEYVKFEDDEYSETQYNVPKVEGINGYTFAGWKLSGATDGSWDADAKTFGITGLAYYAKGSNDGYATLEAQFKKEAKKADAVLRVHYVDENNVPLDGSQFIVSLTKNGTVGEKATFAATSFTAPEGYELVGDDITDVEVAYGKDKDVNVKVKAKKADAVLRVHYVDENGTPLDGSQYIVSLTKNGTVGEKATFAATSFKAPEGYELVGNVTDVEVAYGEGKDVNVNVKAIKEEKEARDVIVNFNVAPEEGQFKDPAGAKVVTYTIKEDSADQFLVPKVEAKEGYEFTGWLVNGKEEGFWSADAKTFGITGLAHFPEGDDKGYIVVTAQFKKAEVAKRSVTINVAIDPEKGEFVGRDDKYATITHTDLDEFAEAPILLPEVKANDGYRLAGWTVEGRESIKLDANATTLGFAGLAHFNDGENVGYISVEPVFEEVKEEKAAVVNANVVVDPEKGEFEGYDGATKLENNNLQEADYTLGFLPTVTAKEGYTWTGWEVTNKAGEVVYTLDTNTSSIMFPYGVEDDYTVTATFTKDETPVDPVDPVDPTEPTQPTEPAQPTQPAQPATPSTDNTVNNATNNTTDNKKVEKTTAKKAETKNENKKAPKTGDESMPIAYMLTLVGAAVAAIIVLIKRKRTI